MLEGKVAVITAGGGAIGGASAVLFAEHGASVVVTDINAERVAGIVDRIRSAGGNAHGVVLDLTKKESIDELYDQATGAFGPVDILVNGLGEHLNAASQPFEEATDEMWEALYEINCLHVYRACRKFVPDMKKRGSGKIVNFSSVEGIRSMPESAVYAACKHAIDAFTKSLGVYLAPNGINVNAIAVDKTKAYQVNFYDLPEEFHKHIPVWIPAGHYAEPEEVASVALFLASDLSSWLVGHTIHADGGTLAAGGWFRTPKRWTNSPLLVQYMEDDPSINEGRPPAVR